MRKPDPTKTVLTNAVKVLTERDQQIRLSALETAARVVQISDATRVLDAANQFYAFLTSK